MDHNAREQQRELAYDDLMELPYLNAVCRETLRLCAFRLTTRCQHTLTLKQVPTGQDLGSHVSACTLIFF